MAVPTGFLPIKPEKVAEVGLGLLARDTVLADTVWRDAGGDFTGAKNDTISLKLPAYAAANKRGLRSADARTRSTLEQRKVDVSLTDDLQVDVPLTDEEVTLDIMSLAQDVTGPAVAGIVRGMDDEVAALMTGATYNTTIDFDGTAPYQAALDLRTALNDANVPIGDRVLVVGSTIENIILGTDKLSDADKSGSSAALREAIIGRFAGFNVVMSNAIAPDEGYAYHRTAFALSSRAPIVPAGAPWGASASAGGFAIRILQNLETGGDIHNVMFHDAWLGSSIVEDHGAVDGNGKFVPSVDPDVDGGTDLLFVRAAKLTYTPPV